MRVLQSLLRIKYNPITNRSIALNAKKKYNRSISRNISTNYMPPNNNNNNNMPTTLFIILVSGFVAYKKY